MLWWSSSLLTLTEAVCKMIVEACLQCKYLFFSYIPYFASVHTNYSFRIGKLTMPAEVYSLLC